MWYNRIGGNLMKVFVSLEILFKRKCIDLAVGVIIGGAFNKIVSSLVNDIIMPLVSLIEEKIFKKLNLF